MANNKQVNIEMFDDIVWECFDWQREILRPDCLQGEVAYRLTSRLDLSPDSLEFRLFHKAIVHTRHVNLNNQLFADYIYCKLLAEFDLDSFVDVDKALRIAFSRCSNYLKFDLNDSDDVAYLMLRLCGTILSSDNLIRIMLKKQYPLSFLHNLGVSHIYNGSKHLVDGVTYLLEHPDYIRLTLTDFLSNGYNIPTTSRNMRTALSRAYRSCADRIDYVMGFKGAKLPRLIDFIKTAANFIRMESNEGEQYNIIGYNVAIGKFDGQIGLRASNSQR